MYKTCREFGFNVVNKKKNKEMMIKQEYITFTNFDTEKANAYLMNRNIELLELSE